MVSLRVRDGIEALGVQPLVDRVRVRRTRVQVAPDLDESPVILATTERARAVARRERRRLVQEEQLGEASGLHQRLAVPAPEFEAAGDPSAHGVTAPDQAALVVQTSAIAVAGSVVRDGGDG